MAPSRTMPSGPTPVGPPLQETDPLTRDDVLDLARCRNGAQMQAAYAGRDAGSNSGQMVSAATGPEAVPSLATQPPVEETDPLIQKMFWLCLHSGIDFQPWLMFCLPDFVSEDVGTDAGCNSGQMVSAASGPEVTPSFATHPPVEEADPLNTEDVLALSTDAGRDACSNLGQMVSTASGPEAPPSFATHPSVEKVDPLNTEDVLALSADVGPEGREAAPSFATHPPVEETDPPNTEDVLALSTEYAIHYSSNSNTTDQISPIEEEDPLNTEDVLDLSGDRCTSDWPAAIASFHPDTTEHTITISPVEEEDPLNTGDVVDLSGPSHASDVTSYPSEETDIFNREDVIDLNQSCPDEEVCVRSSGLEELVNATLDAQTSSAANLVPEIPPNQPLSSGLEELVNATLDAQTSSAANPVPENPPNQPVEETPDMEADDVNLARYRPRVRGGERANARGRIPLEYVQGLGDAPLEHVIDDAEMGLLKIRQCSSSSEERDHRC